VAGHKPLLNYVCRTYLDNLVVNGREERAEFSKIEFNCFKRQYPVTLKGIDVLDCQ